MIFAGMTKSSLLDYPGKISVVLYTPGCNYNCFYCHNRRLIDDISEPISNDEVISFLEKRIGLIDAVVISGGEPTLHYDLLSFLKKVKSMGYLTKLDSNGSSPETIEKTIQENVVDYYAIDYKAPKSRYTEIARNEANPDLVIESIQMLLDYDKNFEVRTTVIPQLGLEDLVQMAEELPQVPRYVLNPYRKPVDYLDEDKDLIDAAPYPEATITDYAVTLKLYQPHIVLPF